MTVPIPDSPTLPRTRTPWAPPRITRIDANAAQNGLNPTRDDGVFSSGS